MTGERETTSSSVLVVAPLSLARPVGVSFLNMSSLALAANDLTRLFVPLGARVIIGTSNFSQGGRGVIAASDFRPLDKILDAMSPLAAHVSKCRAATTKTTKTTKTKSALAAVPSSYLLCPNCYRPSRTCKNSCYKTCMNVPPPNDNFRMVLEHRASKSPSEEGASSPADSSSSLGNFPFLAYKLGLRMLLEGGGGGGDTSSSSVASTTSSSSSSLDATSLCLRSLTHASLPASPSATTPSNWLAGHEHCRKMLAEDGFPTDYLTIRLYSQILARLHLNAFKFNSRVVVADDDDSDDEQGDGSSSSSSSARGHSSSPRSGGQQQQQQQHQHLELEGSALYGLPSFFNHDCDPNAVVQFDGSCVTVFCAPGRTIKAGEEITIDYSYDGRRDDDGSGGGSTSKAASFTGDDDDAESKKRFLKDNYGFDCRCVRCKKRSR